MKPLFLIAVLVCVSRGIVFGGAVETTIMAAMRLAEQPSYSWTAIVEDDARTYDIVAKTVRGEFTHATMPVINSVRRRLGASASDTKLEVFFKGNVDCVLRTEDGWKTVDELPPSRTDDFELAPGTPTTSGGLGSIAGGRSLKHRISGRASIGISSRRIVRNDDLPDPNRYSNLQLAIAHPHEELGVIVSSHTRWEVEGDVITGALSELGAQLLLVQDGQTRITPLAATGTFKLWIRGGLVTRYQLKLQGSLAIETRGRQTHVTVNQVSTVSIRDIGVTVVEVPHEVRKKLNG